MAKKSETYESMLKRLEEIVKASDNGELSLEESMKIYEEGIILCNKLYKSLNESESKIKTLVDGEEKDFLSEEE
ncbi:exodeoxyribonuclease VII small subunit [Clostridium omnivorum]|uniref:Exodeoxyribonuclease 7 small subunit n=1 Tax=Clostridium omnivorum TaxID=1604902 RepID=A0ABQ5NB56_9CLOT|nr:exodeoxyribonuclease VII small subunit [Clostridium sp. E14]GLC32435.1 exodeoxyribonuclease 7 small subunit [Clostridium sp. E14]